MNERGISERTIIRERKFKRLKKKKYMEFFTKYLWWIVWLIITPFVLFTGVTYFILNRLEKSNWDVDDE